MSRRFASACKRLFLCLGLAALLSSATRVVFAGSKDRKEIAAKRACIGGDYAKGVALLADLYVASGDINLIFNQGRCFEQNGKFEEAIVRFLEYQRKNPDKGGAGDLEAQKHIDECQAWLDKRKPAGAAPAPEAAPTPSRQPVVSQGPAEKTALPAAEPVLASPPAPVSVPPASLPVPAPTPAPSPALDLAARSSSSEGSAEARPIYKSWWFWAGAGVVVAGVVATAILLSSKSDSNAPSSTLGNQGVFK